MERRRVVITGLGCVSPVGNSVNEAWENVKNGKSGLGPITLFDASEMPVKIAGEVKNFKPSDHGISPKEARKLARFSQLLCAAAIEAVNDAGFTNESLRENKSGICSGSCLCGLDAIEDGYRKYLDPEKGAGHISPMTTPLKIANEAAAGVSRHFDLRGKSLTVGTACASSTDAIGLSLDMIRSGRLDVVLAGGTDAPIVGFEIGSDYQLSALAYSYNDNPEKASRPFDKDREGFVIAEGAAVLILEELEHAKKRGARIYAEVMGYGSSCDAYHVTAPLPDGTGAALAFEEALEDSGVKREDIQYYNAHGTATVANDAGESAMLKLVFGDYARKLHISSTKSMTGHMLGAAGAMEAVFCTKAIQDSFVPPTINLDNPDIERGCDLDYTPNKGVSMNIDIAASGSLGFGGHNAFIILKKFSE